MNSNWHSFAQLIRKSKPAPDEGDTRSDPEKNSDNKAQSRDVASSPAREAIARPGRATGLLKASRTDFPDPDTFGPRWKSLPAMTCPG